MHDSELVRDFYNQGCHWEWERLDRHPIEFAVTKHYLERYIKPGDRVLDLGGGPGRYSIHLAERGCNVTLMDLSDGNVELARRKSEEHGVRLRACQGDAREADRMISGEFDHVLLMGPLYHLLQQEEREQAVSAALNLLKPGGLFYASFITLFAGFSYYLKDAPGDVLKREEKEYIDCFLQGRTYCGDAFTRACFLNPSEILPFLEEFPLKKLHLIGQEGIAATGENRILECGEDVLHKWIELVLSSCEREEYLPFSEHLLYIGRKESIE